VKKKLELAGHWRRFGRARKDSLLRASGAPPPAAVNRCEAIGRRRERAGRTTSFLCLCQFANASLAPSYFYFLISPPEVHSAIDHPYQCDHDVPYQVERDTECQ
jgi:hypothetical protein